VSGASLSSSAQRLTRRPASSFAAWARDHASDFEG